MQTRTDITVHTYVKTLIICMHTYIANVCDLDSSSITPPSPLFHQNNKVILDDDL